MIAPSIGYGLWQAEKPLIGKEVRYGGKVWNASVWFAIVHSCLCAIRLTIKIICETTKLIKEFDTGNFIYALNHCNWKSLYFTLFVWFLGIALALMIGIILKQDIEEKADML
jgi:hypothetical protein